MAGGSWGSACPGFDQTYNGGTVDAFIVKLAPNGQSLIYATYLGGSGSDAALDIILDSNGAAYVTGFTDSPETSFPNGAGFAGLGVPASTRPTTAARTRS